MVGNGATDFYVDVSPSFPQTIYGLNLITKNIYDKFQNNSCFFSFRHVLISEESTSKECLDSWNLMHELTMDLNWYDLYRKTVPEDSLLRAEDRYGEVTIDGHKKVYKRGKTVSEYTPWIQSENGKILRSGLSDYINSADVRKALNIPNTIQAFDLCTDDIEYTI